MTARRTPAAGRAAGDLAEVETPQVPDFEVVGDDLVCHTFGGLRLSLVVPLPVLDRWTEINIAATGWREQVAAWQAEIIPADVLAMIREAAGGDGVKEIALCRGWSDGLDVRLGKALS